MMEVSRKEFDELAKAQLQNAADISNIANRLGDLVSFAEDSKAFQMRVLFLLDNDKATGEKGVISKVADHEKRIDDIEDARSTEKAKQKVYIGVATFVGGFIMSIASFAWKLIFGK